MPNLVRAPSMPSVPIPTNLSASPSLLRNSQSFDSSSGLARLQSSSKIQTLFINCSEISRLQKDWLLILIFFCMYICSSALQSPLQASFRTGFRVWGTSRPCHGNLWRPQPTSVPPLRAQLPCQCPPASSLSALGVPPGSAAAFPCSANLQVEWGHPLPPQPLLAAACPAPPPSLVHQAPPTAARWPNQHEGTIAFH